MMQNYVMRAKNIIVHHYYMMDVCWEKTWNKNGIVKCVHVAL
jgi:hypothetical protein